jgi:hypothetical protein
MNFIYNADIKDLGFFNLLTDIQNLPQFRKQDTEIFSDYMPHNLAHKN